MQKKFQTATEYLIILAVVIIIGVIVLVALGGIPGIGSGSAERSARVALAAGDIAITDYAVTDDIAVMIVKNNLPHSVRLERMNLENANCPESNIILFPGEFIDVSCNIQNPVSRRYELAVNSTYVDLSSRMSFEVPLGMLVGRRGQGGSAVEEIINPPPPDETIAFGLNFAQSTLFNTGSWTPINGQSRRFYFDDTITGAEYRCKSGHISNFNGLSYGPCSGSNYHIIEVDQDTSNTDKTIPAHVKGMYKLGIEVIINGQVEKNIVHEFYMYPGEMRAVCYGDGQDIFGYSDEHYFNLAKQHIAPHSFGSQSNFKAPFLDIIYSDGTRLRPITFHKMLVLDTDSQGLVLMRRRYTNMFYPSPNTATQENCRLGNSNFRVGQSTYRNCDVIVFNGRGDGACLINGAVETTTGQIKSLMANGNMFSNKIREEWIEGITPCDVVVDQYYYETCGTNEKGTDISNFIELTPAARNALKTHAGLNTQAGDSALILPE